MESLSEACRDSAGSFGVQARAHLIERFVPSVSAHLATVSSSQLSL